MKKLFCCIFGHRFLHKPVEPSNPVNASAPIYNGTIVLDQQYYPLMFQDQYHKVEAVLRWCTRCQEGILDITKRPEQPLKLLVENTEDPEDTLKRYVKARSTFTMLWLKIAGATKFERRLIYKLLKKEFNEQK